ncbi:NADH ubiquinone oxidoreductase [Desulfatiferula olefinivorans]
MNYLGVRAKKPKIAVFDFTGCEGCELQLVNKEDTLIDFLKAVDLAAFREASSTCRDDYEIALIDGAVTRDEEVQRLRDIRARAEVLVALGSCACFGGVNTLKHAVDKEAAGRDVYNDLPVAGGPARALSRVVAVDLMIPGCPVSKEEVESLIRHLVWGTPFHLPAYPVCLECRQRFTTCVFDKGMLCLGPVTQAGCGAPCPAGGLGCWGCRGPCREPNYEAFFQAVRDKGGDRRDVNERLAFFGAFGEVQMP